MNWIGGQRSRMKSRAKTRKQQEFFKKQRLEKTLQKVAPNCPNLGASIDRTDLLKMDIIYKSICSTTGMKQLTMQKQNGYDEAYMWYKLSDHPTSETPTVAAGHLNSSPKRHDNFVIEYNFISNNLILLDILENYISCPSSAVKGKDQIRPMMKHLAMTAPEVPIHLISEMRVELVQPARNSRNSQCLRTRSIHCLLLQR
ncbi:uncharacterized protein LOC115310185 [Ixodes scapularis]|uniref:uncharacterized protein LOC115310185 n=1 Tax=Ixodes scapularis TaxID=6945 RepID=UPI001C3883AE|nr:uncharacterized protein LOC115310185 [Ixodes scapularis]